MNMRTCPNQCSQHCLRILYILVSAAHYRTSAFTLPGYTRDMAITFQVEKYIIMSPVLHRSMFRCSKAGAYETGTMHCHCCPEHELGIQLQPISEASGVAPFLILKSILALVVSNFEAKFSKLLNNIKLTIINSNGCWFCSAVVLKSSPPVLHILHLITPDCRSVGVDSTGSSTMVLGLKGSYMFYLNNILAPQVRHQTIPNIPVIPA